jgi:hypothetical protein
MGIVTGLAGINSQLEKSTPRDNDRVKADYLSLKDGQKVKGRFLQELDSNSPGYNEKAGTGFLAIQHQSPEDFRRTCLCTIDEGECYGCEQYRLGNKDYKQKSKLYINFLVQSPEGDKVVVLSQGNGPKSVTPQLLEMAGEYGTITNRQWTIKRTGSGQTNTSYTLTPLDKDDFAYDVEQHELFDLYKVVYEVPYEDQPRYFGGNQNETKEEVSVGVGSGASGDNEVW